MDPFSIEDLSTHHRRVRQLVTTLVGDPDLGEDAVQGAWVKLLETESARRPRHLSAWLSVTARRVAWNERRSDKRRGDRERSEPQAEALPSSSEIAERAELSARVLGALAALEEPHQSLLRDHYFGDLGLQDLAARDGLPAETIRSRLRRARAAFRSRLESQGLGGDVHWSLAAAPLVFEVSPSPALGAGSLGTATGWIVMKKLAVVFALVALALLGLGLVARLSGTDSRSSGQPNDGGAELNSVASATEESHPQVPTVARSEAERLAPRKNASNPVTGTYHLVKGKVVDGDGRPLEGASVRAESMSEWVGSTEGIGSLGGSVASRGFGTTTLSDGKFSLNLPLPIPPWVTVKVTAGRHRTQYSEVLANEREAVTDKPAQDEDLGLIQLGRASAILGRVIAKDGQPIGGARLTIKSREFGAIGLDATSDADGRYILGHNPAGTFRVSARAHGYFEGVVEGVTMRVGQDTLGVDFVLKHAPLISGRIVDQDGAPIAEQWIYAFPEMASGSSTPTSTNSSASGAFVVSPARPVEHYLEVRRRGYEVVGSDALGRVRVLPGDKDVEVVLRRMPQYRLCVVDDVTGKPIERFGLRVLKDRGKQGRIGRLDERWSPPKIRDRSDGVEIVAARVGVDAVQVAATGYEGYSGEFNLDETGAGVVTLRLKKSPIITGRIRQGGVPVEGASITLDASTSKSSMEGGGIEFARVFKTDKYRRIEVLSDSDGRFEVPTFGQGIVRLTAVAEAGVSVRVLELGVGGHSVGDLELGPYSSVEGRVLVPAGQLAEGLQLWLDEWNSERSVVTGSGGRFRLSGVLPGHHRMVLRGRDPELESMTGDVFEVMPGETATALLDASTIGRAEVQLTVLLDGQPAVGIGIDLGSNQMDPVYEARVLCTFGKCDGLGRVGGFCRTGQSLAVAMQSEAGKLYHPEVLIVSGPGEVQERTVSFEMAGTTLRLPVGFPVDVAWPRNGTVRFEALRSDRSMVLYRRMSRLSEGVLQASDPTQPSIESGDMVLGHLLAGPQILRLTIQDHDHPETVERVGSEAVTMPGPNDCVLEAEVTLRPGGGNVVTLERVP